MSVYAEVYEIVRRIPRGRVLTYGLIADLLGGRLSAQGVGWALRALSKPGKTGRKDKDATVYHSGNVPWHRVINARGGISTHKVGDIPERLQLSLLEAEGVVFDADVTTDLKQYLWTAGLL